MPKNGSNWEHEEETIVSFDAQPSVTEPSAAQGELKRETTQPDDDPDKTIVEEAFSTPRDPDETIISPDVRRVEKVEGLAWLVVTKTGSIRMGQIFALTKTRNDIGRGSDVAIFLNDQKLGRIHATVKCEIIGDEQEFVLHDLASTNGTFVNGQRVSAPVTLKDGDRIGLGDSELAFKRV